MSLVLAGRSRARRSPCREGRHAFSASIERLADGESGGVLLGVGRRHADDGAVLEQHAVEMTVRIMELQLDPALVVELLRRAGRAVSTTTPVASLVSEARLRPGWRPSSSLDRHRLSDDGEANAVDRCGSRAPRFRPPGSTRRRRRRVSDIVRPCPSLGWLAGRGRRAMASCGPYHYQRGARTAYFGREWILCHVLQSYRQSPRPIPSAPMIRTQREAQAAQGASANRLCGSLRRRKIGATLEQDCAIATRSVCASCVAEAPIGSSIVQHNAGGANGNRLHLNWRRDASLRVGELIAMVKASAVPRPQRRRRLPRSRRPAV